MKRFITSFLLAALVGIIGNPIVVFGQEDPDTLLAISEDETLTDEERFTKAKGGLVLALNLSIEKVAKLRTNLEERTYDDGSIENELKVLSISSLDGYDSYYSETLTTAEALTTLEEVQGLAQEVRIYRDEIYTPGIQEIVQFILIFYTDDVIGIANDRFGKISEDINTLESLGLIEEDRFLEETTQIESLLGEAHELNIQAKDIVLVLPDEELISPDEGLEETTTTTTILDISDTDEVSTTTEGATTDEEAPAEETEATNPLETSLNNVKLVYEIFLKISRDVKETLGLD